jgi:hypothetical protein
MGDLNNPTGGAFHWGSQVLYKEDTTRRVQLPQRVERDLSVPVVTQTRRDTDRMVKEFTSGFKKLPVI